MHNGRGVGKDWLVKVMLLDGAAYTEQDWITDDLADFERDEKMRWTFLGKPFEGTIVAL